jgi:hypothetical protein
MLEALKSNLLGWLGQNGKQIIDHVEKLIDHAVEVAVDAAEARLEAVVMAQIARWAPPLAPTAGPMLHAAGEAAEAQIDQFVDHLTDDAAAALKRALDERLGVTADAAAPSGAAGAGVLP